MAKNKFSLQISGFDELLDKLESVEGDLKKTTESALKSSKQVVTPKLKKAMKKHKRTGVTEKSIDTDFNVKWEGDIANINIGFDFQKGGLTSVFLMYGTPKMPPDAELYEAIYGKTTQKEIKQAQTEAFEKVIERLGG